MPADLLKRWEAAPPALPMLVLGDMMLERTLFGATHRMAPDARVPVVLLETEDSVPGGAANVAHNFASLGCPVVTLGFLGDDREGQSLRALLVTRTIEDDSIAIGDWQTITKTRVRCGGELILRLDRERILSGHLLEREQLQQKLSKRLARGAAALIVSDYAKGTLDADACSAAVQAARSAAVPVFVDPSREDWTRYRGATGLFPNVLELAHVAHVDPSDTPGLLLAGRRIRAELALDFLLLKRDRNGVTLITEAEPLTLGATATVVRDVSGAGDTVIATMALALHLGFAPPDAAWLANVAAGLVVAEVGTAPVKATALHHAVTAISPGCAPA